MTLQFHRVDGPHRRHPRFSIRLAVSLSSEHNFYAGPCENLSVGGIFIATDMLLQVGARVDFMIELPDQQIVKGTGEVRWLRTDDETIDVSSGIGIQFRLLEADGALAITEFINEREPLFYDD